LKLPPHNADAVTVDGALSMMRSVVQAVSQTESVHLSDAVGRVLAEEIVSPIDVPGHDNSAMDGWAVRADDCGAALQHAGTAYAGRPFSGELQPGQCVRIMTGAVLPRGADAVVVQEEARADGSSVMVPAAKPGQNVRRAGEDLKRGSVAVSKGTLLRPADIGLVASLGIAKVTVTRRLRVAFFSTGDELRSFEGPAAVGPLAEGQLYDSNRYALRALLERLGCDIRDQGLVPDDPAALDAALRQAGRNADAVVTTGGVSEGAADYTRLAMASLAEVVFWKLAMRPGRPFAFGRFHEGPLLFGLPGNPVAAMVTFYVLVRPMLLAMMGCRSSELPRVQVKAQCAMAKRPGRAEFLRGILECANGEWSVRLTGPQGSGILSSMAQANCLIALAAEQGAVRAGDLVEVLLMDGLV
jgi:molybdopterin molybdotransferase